MFLEVFNPIQNPDSQKVDHSATVQPSEGAINIRLILKMHVNRRKIYISIWQKTAHLLVKNDHV